MSFLAHNHPTNVTMALHSSTLDRYRIDFSSDMASLDLVKLITFLGVVRARKKFIVNTGFM